MFGPTLPLLGLRTKNGLATPRKSLWPFWNASSKRAPMRAMSFSTPFAGVRLRLKPRHQLRRRWIGVDIAIHAVKRVAKVRLEDRLGLKEGVDFTIEGVPRNIEGARDLWTRDKYHFQKWAVEQVDGFVTTRRTGDGGIDGRLYFSMPQQDAKRRDPLRSMVLEVKGRAKRGDRCPARPAGRLGA